MTAPVLVFLGTTYFLSMAIGAIVWLTGGHDSPLVGLGFAAMFVPAIGVLVVTLTSNDGLRGSFGRLPLGYVPLALLVLPVTLHAVMLPLTAFVEGGLPWQPWLTPAADGLHHTPNPPGWGVLTSTALAGRVALNAGVGVIAVTMLAFFEEIGWRAWLLPRLIERLGTRRAIVAVSLIWGLWHAPLVLGGIYFEFDSTPKMLAAAFAMPLGSAAFGLVIGWLWVRSESIWIVALAHGALNNWGQYAFKYMRNFTRADDALILAAGVAGVLVVGSALLIFALPVPDRVRPGWWW